MKTPAPTKTNVIQCYTDGSSLGNPGPWGRAAIIVFPAQEAGAIKEKVLCGGEPHTTNNRMELLAAVRTLYALLGREELIEMNIWTGTNWSQLWGLFGEPTAPVWTKTQFEKPVILSTDSEYVQKWVTEYMSQRIVRNRRTVSRKPVQHMDLRKMIAAVLPLFDNLQRERVRGHNGHEMNERVDQLARREAVKKQRGY